MCIRLDVARAMVLSVATLTVGCAIDDGTRKEVGRSIENWRRAQHRIDVVAIHSESDTVSEPEAEAAPIPMRPSATDPYVQQALSRNPGITAAAADVRAKLQRIPQVTSLPDPVIRALVRPEPIQTAAGDVFVTLGVAQTFPLLAKLERAGDVAAAEARAALERLNAKRVQLIADVERAFWQIYRMDRYIDITRVNRRVLEELERVVHTQYEVGKVPQQDLLRVQTEVAKLRDDENRFQLRRFAAVAALNQLRDRPASLAVADTEPVEPPEIALDANRLITLAADYNPRLAIFRERVERDRAQVKLTELGYWPDLTLGFEWNYVDGRDPSTPPVNPRTGQRPPINRKSEVGDDFWAITMQLNVPIWWLRIEAAKHEARQRLLASQCALDDAENMVAFRVFDAWSQIEAQQHTLGVLHSELIPQSQQAYEVSLIAYQSGRTEFVTLIDNWRRWLDFELMRHRETADLESALADLQREVGLQLVWAGANAPEGDEP